MPDWYWEKSDLKHTPSQVKGMNFDSEMKLRKEGVSFLMELGKVLNLSHVTMATGAVYFHRFYMLHSFQDFSELPIATCCLFLAGKCEETPKKCRDLVRTVRQVTSDKQFETFGVDPEHEIMALEKVLLQTIHFDLQVEHPYQYIIKYAKSLNGEKSKIQKVVQMAWTFVNDSFCTSICLLWEPEIVAIAVMYLAAKLSKFDIKDWKQKIPEQMNWWDQFVEDLEVSDLEDICHSVLDLYNPPQLSKMSSATNGNSTPGPSKKTSGEKKNSTILAPKTPAVKPQPPTKSPAPPPPPVPCATPPAPLRSRSSTPPLPPQPISACTTRPPPIPVIGSVPPLPPLPPGPVVSSVSIPPGLSAPYSVPPPVGYYYMPPGHSAPRPQDLNFSSGPPFFPGGLPPLPVRPNKVLSHPPPHGFQPRY